MLSTTVIPKNKQVVEHDSANQVLTWTGQTTRIFDIANLTFDGVTPEEKQEYTGDTEALGAYKGYKPRNYWVRLVLCLADLSGHRFNLQFWTENRQGGRPD